MLALITFFTFIYFSAKIDAKHYEKEEYVEDYGLRFLQRLSVAVILLTLNINLAIGFIFLFWSTFEVTLNKLRGYDIWNIEDNKLEYNFFKDKPLLYYKISKILTLLIALSILL